tara:strand:- start:326 stop:541 length:216 start_codon:yes stop_codon:yes gene_type:complete
MRFQFDSDVEAVIWGVGFFLIGGVGALLGLPEMGVVAVFWLLLGKRAAKLFIWITKKIVWLTKKIVRLFKK